MSTSPDKDNLEYEWLAKAKLEEERACLKKFEEDKALKDKKPLSPWTAEEWQAAREYAKSGLPEEARFPVIITSSGPFTTPEKIQEVAGLSSVPEVKRTTLTSVLEEEAKELDKEEVLYCDVNWKQLKRVRAYSEGKDVIVWFEEKQRFAWLAHSMSPEAELAEKEGVA